MSERREGGLGRVIGGILLVLLGTVSSGRSDTCVDGTPGHACLPDGGHAWGTPYVGHQEGRWDGGTIGWQRGDGSTCPVGEAGECRWLRQWDTVMLPDGGYEYVIRVSERVETAWPSPGGAVRERWIEFSDGGVKRFKAQPLWKRTIDNQWEEVPKARKGKR